MTSSRMTGPTDRDELARIQAEARDWALRPEGEDAAARAAWCAADPRHERALREACLAWSAIGRTPTAGDDGWRREAKGLARATLVRRLLAPTAAAACFVAGVVLALPLLDGPKPILYATRTAETRELKLADGSRLFVGARSAVDVRVDHRKREVSLKQGEAFFEVAHDPAHPFYVLAGDTRIRVVGTKFDVVRVGDQVRVSVLEGRVEVSRKPLLPLLPAAGGRNVLTGGEQVRAAGSDEGKVTAIGIAEPGAWRGGRLLYADAPLSEVVADANRYSSHPIRLASADIGELRVTATFRTTAIDDLIANLDQALPIHAQKAADGSVTLSADQVR